MCPNGVIVCKKRLASNKGQALVEGALSAGVWLIFSVILLNLAYMVWVKYCLCFIAREDLLCRQIYTPNLSRYGQQNWCKTKAQNQLKKILPIGRLTAFSHSQSSNFDSNKIHWQIPIKLFVMNDSDFRFSYEIKETESVSLPLEKQ